MQAQDLELKGLGWLKQYADTMLTAFYEGRSPEQRAVLEILFVKTLKEFSDDAMELLALDSCPGGLQRCRDGSCVVPGGC